MSYTGAAATSAASKTAIASASVFAETHFATTSSTSRRPRQPALRIGEVGVLDEVVAADRRNTLSANSR